MATEQLIRKRGTIKTKLTNFKKYLDPLKGKPSLTDCEVYELQDRTTKIDALLEEFDGLQSEIECSVEETKLDEQYAERESFENNYFSLLSEAKKMIADNTKEVKLSDNNSQSGSVISNNMQQSSQVTQENAVKLPPIPLTKFNGTYDAWLEFRDTYEALIHTNSGLSDIQKYHYLRSSLEGGAAQVIRSLEFTRHNYVIAWTALCERYNNTRLLVHNHVKSLFSLEPLKKESSTEIRGMIDNVSKNLNSLAQLEQPTGEWDTLINFIVTDKLDSRTARQWEEHKCENELPTWEDFKKFLRGRADLLETLEQNNVVKTAENKTRQELNRGNVARNTKGLYVGNNQCVFCKKEHYTSNCEEFLKLSVNDRIERVKKMRLCLNCLKVGHFSKYCRRGPCKKCNVRHNTLLHIENGETASSTETSSSENAKVLTSIYGGSKQMLLSTACVEALDKDAKPYVVRVLLDCAAQSNFITKELANKLRLTKAKINFAVEGLERNTTNTEFQCNVTIKSLHTSFSANINCLILNEITGYIPEIRIDRTDIIVPKNIILADPSYYKPEKIDLLLGVELYYSLLCIGQISLNSSGLMLQKTRLGWVFGGPIDNTKTIGNSYCNLSINVEVQEQLKRFWEIEECSVSSKVLSQEEIACEQQFKETTKRAKDGRFIVALPLKGSTECLGDSKEQAQRRFWALERKFKRNSTFHEKYVQFMSEYRSMGHMTEVTENSNDKTEYYMPHHGVLRDDSLTTKLRVVFDASAPSSTGISLNDIQMVGPVLQNDLFLLLLRFRKHRFVVSADIAKMYRQVLICPAQRSLQRIIWRDSQSEPLKTYELTTVTYGHAAAPYLAIRCLIEIANNIESCQPEIAEIIRDDFFVDDLLSGSDTIEGASYICENVSKALKDGSFELRKWYSNEPSILKNVNKPGEEFSVLEFGENDSAKTLGLTWCCNPDVLKYNIKEYSNGEKVTKRSVLSHIAQIFDPLGLLSPCVIIAKIILQKIWLAKLSWDESLPAQLHAMWVKFRTELTELNKLRVPRHVMCPEPVIIEMHCFSDASTEAYGGCIYIRTIDKAGGIYVRLLCAKSKVAPLKPLTVPRLELCAALITARLAEKVRSSLKVHITMCTFWTDSTIVLGWLRTPPNNLKTFVCNRVAEVQSATNPHEWRHVPTEKNPADMVSRGIFPKQIEAAELWWHGPDWLRKEKENWPELSRSFENLPELRPNLKVLTSTNNDFIFTMYSDFNKLKRIIALMLRFKRNCKVEPNDRTVGSLTTIELNDAIICLVKLSQGISFAKEVECLKQGKALKRTSSILNLNPFMDENGVLRVGGRIRHAKFCFDKKHPMLISSKHPIAKLIFVNEHLRLLHAGPQLLLASVRERFWPTLGRNLARATVKNCQKCFRYNPQSVSPIMGDLPPSRLSSGYAFEVVGVDYAGPFHIKDRKGRGGKIQKCYLSLFICFASKAVHLELVSDLSTESFILALRRFVARRGLPSHIYSDNGSNFIGAEKELNILGKFLIANETKLKDLYVQENVQWHFIPAHSPHFGGLWEAGVKSTKYHLKRVAGCANLTFEELYSLIVQVESILNSRPLCPLSTDPNDYSPLTPAHFLVGKTLIGVPDPDLSHIPENRLSRYQRVQQIRQHFWKRWSLEYVGELQIRAKWKKTESQLQPNELVLVRDDNLPPSRWRLGRISSVHPGRDGISRVATIKTSAGEIKRSFSRICPLPCVKC